MFDMSVVEPLAGHPGVFDVRPHPFALTAAVLDDTGWTVRRVALPPVAEPEERAPGLGGEVPSGWLALELDTGTDCPAALSDAALLDGIVGFERVVSWASARQARLLAEFAVRRPRDEVPSVERASVASPFAPDEVGLVLNMARGTAAARIGTACRLRAVLPDTLASWEAGRIDTAKARAIHDTTLVLPDDLARAVEARVLPRAPEQSLAQLRAALARAVIAVDPDGAATRHTEARKDRRVYVQAEPDGMGSLWALLTAADAQGAYAWLTRLARGLGTDDPRSMDARRADLLAELLNGRLIPDVDDVDHDPVEDLGNDVADTTSPNTTSPDTTSPDKSNSDGDRADSNGADSNGADSSVADIAADGVTGGDGPVAAEPAAGDAVGGPTPAGPASGGPAPTGPAPIGPAPTGPAPIGPAPIGPAPTGPAPTGPAPTGPAADGRRGRLRVRPVTPGKPLIQVVMPYSTLIGADDQPADLAGYGPIPADLAREIAADGVWRRLVTDPLSGTVLDYGRTTYRPPAGLADFVRARDLHCRGPLCRRKVTDGELDHIVAWADGGETTEKNLAGDCLHHHKLKHHARWRVEAHPDGRLTWITPTGHRYTTAPHDYRPDPPPPTSGRPVPSPPGDPPPNACGVDDEEPPPF